MLHATTLVSDTAERTPRLLDGEEPGGPGGGEQRHLGLGLYIVDKIVRAHGGSVDVTSSTEEGTTFTVRLPPVAAAASRRQ